MRVYKVDTVDNLTLSLPPEQQNLEGALNAITAEGWILEQVLPGALPGDDRIVAYEDTYS